MEEIKSWKETNIVPEAVEDKERVFMYVAEYENGTIIPEYEDDGKETLFTEVEKDKVKTLSIIGRGSVPCVITTDTGIFKVFDNTFEYGLLMGGERYNITSIIGEAYKDIIQYKGFITDGLESSHTGGATLKCHTTSFSIGWKKKIILDEERSVFFKAIFSIVINKEIKLDVKLTPNFNLDGTLVVTVNGEDKSCVVNIEKGTSKEITTNFK